MTDALDSLLDKAAAAAPEARQQPQSESEQQDSLPWSSKARLALQGLTLNYGDEGFAQIRSILSRAAGGDLTYEQAVDEERKIIDSAREEFPAQSIGLEVAGAIIPSIATTVFSAGGALPAVAANIARIFGQIGLREGIKRVGKQSLKGAAEGFVAGTGSGKGGLEDRVANTGTLITTAAGGTAAPVLGGLVKGAGRVIGSIADRDVIRKMLGSLSKADSAEIQRVAGETGLSIDEIISRITAGETLPEMGPLAGQISEATSINIRSLYNRAGKGRGEIEGTLRSRADDKSQEAATTLQEGLTPKPLITAGEGGVRTPASGTVVGTAPGLVKGTGPGNILKYFGKGIKDLKADEGAAYDKIFKIGIDPSEELNSAVLEVLTNQKRLRPKINALLEASNQPKLFEINPETKVLELVRDIDLETGEILRRSLSDRVNVAFRSGEGAMAEAVGALEKKLRSVLDDVSSDLKDTRAAWSAISRSAEAFAEGSKILTKKADEVDVIFSDLLSKGDQDAVAAFRSGYASALRNKLSAGNRTSLFNNLNDVNKKDRLILQTIYPGDDLATAVDKITSASKAANVRNTVLGGSPTAATQAASKKIGTASGLANLAEVIMNPSNIFAAGRLLRDFVGPSMENLSPEQITTITRTLLTENPDVMRKALKDESAFGFISKRANELVDVLSSGVRRGAASTSAADVQSDSGNRAVRSIVESASPATKEKIRVVSQQ
tara:strand:- start:201 stop:2372 length:2172 start_codon:yes stop_codon:yes gene_type:complete